MSSKEKETSSKSINLNNKDKKILRSIDKSSKWEDIKGVEELNNEIMNLDIYKDFIGLGCSRYLNESAETGKLDIEEMFRNCREAEKVRQRVKKKEKREEAKGQRAGKAGLTRGNIGAQTKEVKPKEVDSQQIKDDPFINQAIKYSEELISGLTKTSKNADWKEVVAKMGLKVGLESLLGITIAVMKYGKTDPVGAIAITTTALGIIGEIYKYIYEQETGEVITDIKKFISSKMKELYDYMFKNGKGIIKKKKKKKPFDRGSSKKDDDDDDDSDDSDSGDYSIDFDELNEYTNQNEIKEEEEEPKKEEQDLAPRQQPQAETNVDKLYNIMSGQLAQAQSQLINTNTEKLFRQNENQKNPLPATTEPPRQQTNIPPQEPAREEQQQEPLFKDTNYYGEILGGAGLATSVFGAMNRGSMRDMFRPTNFDIPLQPQPDIREELIPTNPLNQPQPNTDSVALNDPPRQNPQQDNLNQQGRMTDERREQEEQLRRQEQERKKEAEQERRMNQQIDDMGIHGRAWGSFLGMSGGGGGSKLQQQSIQMPISMSDLQEQQSLLQDVEDSANQARETAMNIAEENQRLEAEISLVRAQQGQEEERKMTELEARIMGEQRLGEEKARGNRIFDMNRGINIADTTMEQLSIQRQEPAQTIMNPLEQMPIYEDMVREPNPLNINTEGLMTSTGYLQPSRRPPLEMSSLQPVMRADREQNLIQRTLAEESIIGFRGRGRPLTEAEPSARNIMFQVLNIPQTNQLTISQLEDAISNVPEPLVNDMLQIAEEVRDRIKTKKGGNKLKADEIEAIARIASNYFETQMRREPPRQPRGLQRRSREREEFEEILDVFDKIQGKKK